MQCPENPHIKMNNYGIDQVPVTDKGNFVGSLSDTKVLKVLIDKPSIKEDTVGEIMDSSFQFVGMDNTVDVLSSLISKEKKALLVRDENQKVHIITQSDLLYSMMN